MVVPGAVADQSNQNIYNTAWQNYQPDVDPNVCLEDWNEQNVQFFEMLIKKEQAKGNRKGIRKAQSKYLMNTSILEKSCQIFSLAGCFSRIAYSSEILCIS